MTRADDADLARAAAILREAAPVLVLTGAGISADSGVPTFRGDGGLWREFRAEELATPGAFARDPRLVWEWYAWRREAVGACEPNAAHLALAAWQARGADVAIATQNVDGLHGLAARRAAGDRTAPGAPGTLLELHGSLFRVRCTVCGRRREHRDAIDASATAALPRCGARGCGGLLRPDVVWFGEALDPGTIERAFALSARAACCLVVGTSAVVHPAASLADSTRGAGGAVIEVNPERTPLTPAAAVSIRAGAADVVPRLVPGPA